MTETGHTSNPDIAARWRSLLWWLDGWFEPDKVDRHGFDPAERALFEELSRAWRDGDDKIAALEGCAARHGRERVLALVGTLCADETSAHWADVVAREGGTLDVLYRVLWEPLPAEGFEFDVERTPDTLHFRCTRCPQNDLAADLDARDWLYAMVCSTDFHVTAAFDPPIRFERTRTLMQGDEYCNHAYFVERPVI
jgi:hypothetical protein